MEGFIIVMSLNVLFCVSVSGDILSGTGSSYRGYGSRAKVYDWLKENHGTSVSSLGYASCTEATSSTGYDLTSAGTSSSGHVSLAEARQINPYANSQTEKTIYQN